MESSKQNDSNIDTGCIALVLLARFHHIAADPKALLHQFGQSGQSFSNNDILRSASYLKLKAKAVKCNTDDLSGITLPAIAKGNDNQYFILAQYDPEQG